MLTILKNAIKKKKLYFIVKYSTINLKWLNFLLKINLISSYQTRLNKKKTFIVAFVNYNINFDFIISDLAKNDNKTLLQKNTNTKKFVTNYNFILNTNHFKQHLGGYKQIKFR